MTGIHDESKELKAAFDTLIYINNTVWLSPCKHCGTTGLDYRVLCVRCGPMRLTVFHRRRIIRMGDRSFIQINFILLLIPVMGKDELDKLLCSQHMGLHGSVGRTLQC